MAIQTGALPSARRYGLKHMDQTSPKKVVAPALPGLESDRLQRLFDDVEFKPDGSLELTFNAKGLALLQLLDPTVIKH